MNTERHPYRSLDTNIAGDNEGQEEQELYQIVSLLQAIPLERWGIDSGKLVPAWEADLGLGRKVDIHNGVVTVWNEGVRLAEVDVRTWPKEAALKVAKFVDELRVKYNKRQVQEVISFLSQPLPEGGI